MALKLSHHPESKKVLDAVNAFPSGVFRLRPPHSFRDPIGAGTSTGTLDFPQNLKNYKELQGPISHSHHSLTVTVTRAVLDLVPGAGDPEEQAVAPGPASL